MTATHSCPLCGSARRHASQLCRVCLSPEIYTFAKDGLKDVSGGRVWETPAREEQKPKAPARTRKKRARKSRAPAAAPLAAPRALARREGPASVARSLGLARRLWRGMSLAAAVHVVLLIALLFVRYRIPAFETYVQQVVAEDVLAEVPGLMAPPDRLADPADFGEPEDPAEDSPSAPSNDMIEAPVNDVPPPPPAELPPLPDPLPETSRTDPSGRIDGLPPRERPDRGQVDSGARRSRDPGDGKGMFGNRKGEARESAVKKYGGDAETEKAVGRGLNYLARVQCEDGRWDPRTTGNACAVAGLTALCTLPFLAAGNSPEEGDYKENVKKALDWLMRQQASDGSVGNQDMYSHSLATMALCEAYGMCKDKTLGKAAERAVRFLERTQSAKGGWDYTPGETTSTSTRFRNDLSITGWAVLALCDAKEAGISVKQATFDRMADLYDEYYKSTGETYYDDTMPHGGRAGPGMAAVGLVCRTLLDPKRFKNKSRKTRQYLMGYVPKWEKLSDGRETLVSFYGWYYGTLGMFLSTGGKGAFWRKWNSAVKRELLEHQVEKEGENEGSWDPADAWLGPYAGRQYSTACCLLCLEVYYRYNVSGGDGAHDRDDEKTSEDAEASPKSIGSGAD